MPLVQQEDGQGTRPVVMGRAGVEARARKGASHPKRAKRLLAPKRKPRNSFPPSEASLCHVPPHESSIKRLDPYCVEKKEAPESTDSENEEAPHGGERGF